MIPPAGHKHQFSLFLESLQPHTSTRARSQSVFSVDTDQYGHRLLPKIDITSPYARSLSKTMDESLPPSPPKPTHPVFAQRPFQRRRYFCLAVVLLLAFCFWGARGCGSCGELARRGGSEGGGWGGGASRPKSLRTSGLLRFDLIGSVI